jgi:hypothetical protein
MMKFTFAQLDQLRHDLVHKLKFLRILRQPSAKAEYLLNTAEFFINLLDNCYEAEVAVGAP